jgi:hypothetical protein
MKLELAQRQKDQRDSESIGKLFRFLFPQRLPDKKLSRGIVGTLLQFQIGLEAE